MSGKSLTGVLRAFVSPSDQSVTRTAPALVALVLVALLVLSPAVALAAGQGSTTAGNASEEFTRGELLRNGNVPGESPDSVRLADGETPRIWYIEHLPASNPAARYPDDLEKMPESHTLNRNEIYLRTIRTDYGDLQKTVKVVYWNSARRQIETEEGTRTELVAQNVTVQTHQLSFGRGWATQKISLPVHNTPTHVSIWIEGEPGARWHFKHKSTATSEPANIDTQGDYWFQMFSDVLIWILGGGLLISWAVMKAIDKAAKGPGYGPIPYVIVLTFGLIFAVFVFYDSLADVLVNAPFIPALFLVGMIGVFILETYSSGVRKVQFLKPRLAASTSPSGEDGYDIIDLEELSVQVVRMNDGRDAVVRTGVFPFLARVFGKAAILEGIGDLRTRVDVIDSKHDEMFWIDPDSEEILEFKPPGFSLEIPEFTSDNIPMFAIGAAAVTFLGLMVAGGAVGGLTAAAVAGLGFGLVAIRPHDGHARVEPASAYQRSAFASMLYLSLEIEDARTYDEAKEQLRQERARSLKDIDQELEQHDTTIIGEMFDGDVSASIRNDEAQESTLETTEGGESARRNGSSESEESK